MYKDEIISEVWRIRDEYAAEHNHNLKEMVADLKKRQLRSHRVVVNRRSAKRARKVKAKADRR
jgi:hypothetical protein